MLLGEEEEPYKQTSSLNVNPEQLAERNEKRNLINKLLPLTVLGFLAIDVATGGALNNIEFKGPTPPGVEAARKLKAEKGYK